MQPEHGAGERTGPNQRGFGQLSGSEIGEAPGSDPDEHRADQDDSSTQGQQWAIVGGGHL
jgi:hypothetical protein